MFMSVLCVEYTANHRRSSSAQAFSHSCGLSDSSSNSMHTPTRSIATPTSETLDMLGLIDSQRASVERQPLNDVGGSDMEGEQRVSYGSIGSPSVDRALLQHLIHCERLLIVSHSLQ